MSNEELIRSEIEKKQGDLPYFVSKDFIRNIISKNKREGGLVYKKKEESKEKETVVETSELKFQQACSTDLPKKNKL